MRRNVAKAIPYIVLGLVFLLAVLLNLFCHDNWLDSDMAAEMIFSKLLAQERHLFATPQWYYSTEFRFLYTHWIMGPLFRVLQDWHVIRAVTNILSYVLMLASYYYFMGPFHVRKSLVVMTSVMLLLPFSETMMTHVLMGNTYIFHVVIVFLFFGLYLRLVGVNRDGKRRVLRWICYLGLALICGVSGVRYLLALQCPLVIAAFLYLLRTSEFGQIRRNLRADNMGTVWAPLWKCAAMKYFVYSLLGAAGSVAGYAVNVLYVSKKYVFQTYDATNFIAVYQGVLMERLQNAVGSLLMFFGYIPDRGVLSLRGVITILAFVLTTVFGYCTVKIYRGTCGQRFFVTLFLVVSFALNLFVFVFTTSTMVPRYYITVFIFVLPVLCFYLEREELFFDRLAVSLILIGCLTAASGKTVMSYITVDKNASKRPVAQFLREEGYTFGYASYWNANIVTELTDGEVEIANVGDPRYLEYFQWSSPMKYYENGYHKGETFLLLTEEEIRESAGCAALRQGRVVYEDGGYTVFVYDSPETLMKLAESRR